jgi:hypothetical protein
MVITEVALGSPVRLSSSCWQRRHPLLPACTAGSRLRRLTAALSAGRAHKLGGDHPQGERQSVPVRVRMLVSEGAGSCEGGIAQGRPSKVVRREVLVILGSSGTFNNLITN